MDRKTILQLHETGSHPWLEEMRHEVPPGLLEMLNVPGLPADKII
jgi:DNA polymerase (family X)